MKKIIKQLRITEIRLTILLKHLTFGLMYPVNSTDRAVWTIEYQLYMYEVEALKHKISELLN